MSVLIKLVKSMFSHTAEQRPAPQEIGENYLPSSAHNSHLSGNARDPSKKNVLNVGGQSKRIELPPLYLGWEHVLLDIDPREAPDIVCDAREMSFLPHSQFDAIYCSHNLEHYYRHDASKVLAGFLHVLKEDGFAHIRVPNMRALMRTVVEKNMDIEDVLYESPAGPITVHDVIYGYGIEVERSGNDFYAHKAGFTQDSLIAVLIKCGFSYVYADSDELEIVAYAFKNKPDESTKRAMSLPPQANSVAGESTR